MLRILLASLLTLAAFAAIAPTASATCIDATPDDNGVGTTGCNVPVVGNCHVLVYSNLPGVSNDCLPVDCVRECGPPSSSAASASVALCSGDLNPTDDNGIRQRCRVAGQDCTVTALAYGDPLPSTFCYRLFIPCVSEPCATPLESSMIGGPCSSDLNPTDDNGVSTRCNVSGVRCSAWALRYGPANPPASAQCEPPIVCVRECGPPIDSTAAMAGPCTNDLDPTDGNGIGGRCTVGPATCSWRALSSLDVPQTPRCDPGFIYCVTEPCYFY